MARRKLQNKEVRKLGKLGPTSYFITLPIELVKKLSWRLRQKVTVTTKGDDLVVKDWKKK